MKKSPKSEITIEVYSDFACPWCHLGRKILQSALTTYFAKNPSAKINVKIYPFIVHPEIVAAGIPLPEKYYAIRESMKTNGKIVNCSFANWNYMANSTLAHCLALQAANEGKRESVSDELFRLGFEVGENISDPEVLKKVAEQMEVKGDWNTKELENEVVEINKICKEASKVEKVPYYVIEGEIAFEGATKPEDFIEVFEKYFK